MSKKTKSSAATRRNARSRKGASAGMAHGKRATSGRSSLARGSALDTSPAGITRAFMQKVKQLGISPERGLRILAGLEPPPAAIDPDDDGYCPSCND